jgi:hypothetical protein
VRAQFLESREKLGLARKRALAPYAVDRAVAGGGDDPRARVVGRSIARPAFERGCERVLNCVLGELEVAENADQDRDCASPFLAEEGFDR